MTFFQNHLLSVILFTPLAGAILLLFVNKRQENAIRWIANLVAFLGLLVSLPLWFRYEPGGAAVAVRRAGGVDPVDRRELLPRRGRLQRVADPADHDDGVHRDPVVLDRHHRAGEGVLHLPARPPDGHDWRVRLARLPAVLPLLGSDARADVFPHRHLGRRAPPLLGDQVLPLHPGRQRRDAPRHPRALLLLCAEFWATRARSTSRCSSR